MRTRRLGKDLEVAELGLGCMGMSQFYGDADERESMGTIRRALDLGVTMLDTADMYGAGANERLVGVVGLSPPVDDKVNAAIYDPPFHINPLRSFPGLGVQLWGARTLSQDAWMRYLPVRRCLSAIERRVLAALRP